MVVHTTSLRVKEPEGDVFAWHQGECVCKARLGQVYENIYRIEWNATVTDGRICGGRSDTTRACVRCCHSPVSAPCANQPFLNTWLECVTFVDAHKVKNSLRSQRLHDPPAYRPHDQAFLNTWLECVTFVDGHKVRTVSALYRIPPTFHPSSTTWIECITFVDAHKVITPDIMVCLHCPTDMKTDKKWACRIVWSCSYHIEKDDNTAYHWVLSTCSRSQYWSLAVWMDHYTVPDVS